MNIKELIIKNDMSLTDITEQTKSYCPLPWSHLHISAKGDVLPCCIGNWDLPLGNINEQSFDEIWQGDKINKMRKALIDDKKVPECSTCYLKEKDSGFSLRHDNINNFHEVSKEMVLSTNEDGSAPLAKPVYWDIRFSNICNMRCRMCGHFSSSKWFADAESLTKDGLSNYSTDSDTAIIHGVEESEKLLNRLEEYLPYVKEIYFAGGEPLFMEEHYTIMNKLIEMGLTDIFIRYNSNMSIMKYKKTNVIDLWKKFSNVYCAASIDTYGDRAENIRKDTDWNVIEKNIGLIKTNAPDVWVTIAPTIQIMNAYSVCELNEQWITNGWVNRWSMSWNILSNPGFFNIQYLPDHMKEEIETIWRSHLKWLDINKSAPAAQTINTAIKWMNSGTFNADKLIEMCEHTKRIDLLRGEDTRATFPELNYIWENYWK